MTTTQAKIKQSYILLPDGQRLQAGDMVSIDNKDVLKIDSIALIHDTVYIVLDGFRIKFERFKHRIVKA